MTTLLGCDFSSAPSRRKPIVHAVGHVDRGRVVLTRLDRFESLDAWASWLVDDAHLPWVGGFDLPFGLPRELVEHLGWPTIWTDCIRHYASLSRQDIRAAFASFCQKRPTGGKFVHRATDRPAGSSPSMKWVNPPVAFMLHAGVPRLLQAGADFPGLQAGDGRRVALEAYPGLLARSVLGSASYKSDEIRRQTADRLIARRTLVHALENGDPPLMRGAGLRLKLSHSQRDALANDASGDSLDAVQCLIQAAWGWQARERGDERWGLPVFDPLEGWILGA
ncbi:MAG: DUF429 domain-containing protein [Gammaproteobacteria bacterium]